MSRPVVLSLGMGLDSTGVLVRWLTDPASRSFPLSALTVLVSQVGDEYPDTYRNVVDVILPMLRAHRIRLVQVARPALTIGRGGKRYVVLDDSVTPTRLVRSGPVRLSDELFRNGTIAQVSNRRCSLRWKGEVLDAWLADHMPPGFTHVLGYDADEQRRADRDAGIIRHGRRPDYPLIRWGWTRDTTRRFLYDATGRTWNRSCCSHCPFQSATIGRGEWAQRWRDHPAAGALGLQLEYSALALNPRMRLFGAHSGWDLATHHQLTGALSAARAQLATSPWAVYEVRRTFTAPNTAMRSVRAVAFGTPAQMQATLTRTASGTVTTDANGIHRIWIRPPGAEFPRVEHLMVAAPAGIADKQRAGFEPAWSALTNRDTPHCAGTP